MANKEKTATKKSSKVNKKAKVNTENKHAAFSNEPVTKVIFTNPETDLVIVNESLVECTKNCATCEVCNESKPAKKGFFRRIADWFKRK